MLVVVDGLVYVSHHIVSFSDALIQQIRSQFASTPGNELRGVIKLAAQLLVSESIRQALYIPQSYA